MSSLKRIVVQGGGNNLYQVRISGTDHLVEKVAVGLISNSYQKLGRAESFDDALSIIRSHSGREIQSISR